MLKPHIGTIRICVDDTDYEVEFKHYPYRAGRRRDGAPYAEPDDEERVEILAVSLNGKEVDDDKWDHGFLMAVQQTVIESRYWEGI